MGEIRFGKQVMRRAGRGVRSLLVDSTGGPMMEYAFVGPMFIALIIAILQIALVFLAQEGLETAAETSARYLLTGQAQLAGWTQAQYTAKACAALPAYMSCSRLYVDVVNVTSYSAAVTSMPTITYKNGKVTNTFAYTPGTQGAIVVVRLMYLWPTVTGPLGFTLVNVGSSSRMLLATSVLKSEGYSAISS